VNTFLWNIALAVVWATASGRFTLTNLLLGYGLGYLVLVFTQPLIGPSRYFLKLWQVLGFLMFLFWEVIRANLRVAYDVITPTYYMHPGVVAIPLDARTDTEITVLANLISLTPGTLSLDVSDDRKYLYIHAMFIRDPDALRDEIKRGLERRVLELLR
jgi:multicomponent Na+:H+ antiporter subunit E